MELKKIFAMGLLCFFFLLLSGGVFAAEDPNAASAEIAKDWLKLVDDGKYAESWNSASLRTKMTIQKGEWEQIMEATRKPLGRTLSRAISVQQIVENPKGLPVGQYMMIVYKTVFANKSEGTELVTLVLGDDNRWHVMTYVVN